MVLEPCNGLSSFKVSQLLSWRHDQSMFDCSQMPPYKATNVTTFHTQRQLLHVHHTIFPVGSSWECTSKAFNICICLPSHSTLPENLVEMVCWLNNTHALFNENSQQFCFSGKQNRIYTHLKLPPIFSNWSLIFCV